MNIEVRKSRGVAVLECAGHITFGPGKVTLRDTFLEHLTAGERRFVLNLREVPYLDTPSLGEVVACWKRAAETGGTLKVVLEPGGRVEKLFRLTGFDKIFDVHPDVDAAIAAYGDG